MGFAGRVVVFLLVSGSVVVVEVTIVLVSFFCVRPVLRLLQVVGYLVLLFLPLFK
jgi:hypothetical protein